MKKLCSTLLCLVLLVGVLGGCQGKEEESSLPSSSLPQSSTVEEEPEKSGPWQIGLIQYEEHDALDNLRQAFMSRLEEWGCDDTQVEIDYQNAQGDPEKAETICQDFVEDSVDMIVALSTPGAQAALEAAKDSQVAVVFAGVSTLEPLPMEGVENATGVISPTPVTQLLNLALQADSGLSTLGVLYNPEEEQSVVDVETVKTYCSEQGVEVVESTVSQGDDVAQAATDLCASVDALFTPADNTVALDAASVAQAASAAGVPWYAAATSMVQQGALAALGVTEREMGQKAADLAVEVIQGRPASEVPVYTFSEQNTFLNLTTLNSLDRVTLSQEIQQSAYIYQ